MKAFIAKGIQTKLEPNDPKLTNIEGTPLEPLTVNPKYSESLLSINKITPQNSTKSIDYNDIDHIGNFNSFGLMKKSKKKD